MVSDEALYQRIQAGDLSAFDSLYERYRLRLFRFIYSYLKNQQESEDLFQEAFLKVFKKTDLDFANGSFQAWIFETARNLALNQLRGRSRAENAYHTILPGSGLPLVDIQLQTHAISNQVENAVKKLPAPQAEVFQLKILGLPEKEIARTLQIPLGTVKSRFHQLIEFIKQEVKE